MVDMVKQYTIPPNVNGTPRTNEERRNYLMLVFAIDFPTEAACVDALYEWRFPNGGICLCGSLDVQRKRGSRNFKCNKCHTINWISAGTSYHYVKKLKARFLFDTFTQNGVSVSVKEFSEIASIHYKTARKIFGTVATVIETHMTHSFVIVPSKCFVKAFYKRSFDTPAKEHPASEQTEMEKATESNNASKNQTRVSLKKLIRVTAKLGELGRNMRIVYKALSSTPINEDNLCLKTDLEYGSVSGSLFELEGQQLIKIVPGGYIRADSPAQPVPVIVRTVPEFIEFVATTYYGIARKYLQKYLAYWWFLRLTGQRTRFLIDMCLQSGPIRRDAGMSRIYVTPLSVKLAA